MTFDEAKTLLSRIAVLDNRTVDATSISMWEAVLAPFTFAECMWALREFARNNVTDYLRPAHLVSIIRRKREICTSMERSSASHSRPRARFISLSRVSG